MKISKEAKVGLLAVIAGSVLYIGFNFLKGVDFFSPNNTYFAIYDKIDGLSPSNPIMINGLTVGRVGSITIMQHRQNKILVELDIEDDIVLSDSTVALLIDSDFLGSKAIVLEVGRVVNVLQEGDTIRGIVDQGMAEAIKETAMPVINNVDDAVTNLNKILANIANNEAGINQTIDNFRQTSEDIKLLAAENRQQISKVSSDMARLSGALSDPDKGIIPMLAKLNQFTDTLNNLQVTQVMDKANLAMQNLNTILNDIKEGHGTLGKLAHNDSLYRNLNQSARDLDRLLIDVRQNPKRYVHFSVFGRKDKSKDKVEEEELRDIVIE